MGERIECEARVTEYGKGRSIRAQGTISRDGEVAALAKGVMVIVKEPGTKAGL